MRATLRGSDRRADRCRDLRRIRPADVPRRRRAVGRAPGRGRGDAGRLRPRPGPRAALLQCAPGAAARSGVAPNAAHLALAELERALAGRVAGGHAERRRPARARRQPKPDPPARRAEAGLVPRLRGRPRRGTAIWAPNRGCPACGAAGRLRPDIVWFGEMPYRMDEVYAALERCRALRRRSAPPGRSIPAAGFVRPRPRAGDAAHDRAQPRALGGGRSVRRAPAGAAGERCRASSRAPCRAGRLDRR